MPADFTLRVVILAAGLLLAGTCEAQGIISRIILQRVETAVDRPLPTVAEVLGAEPSAVIAPIVAIGFLENGNPSDQMDWGGAIGWYLMEAANGAFPDLAIVSSDQYASDGTVDTGDLAGTRREELQRVAVRNGARFGIAGSIYVRGDQFDLSLELLAFPALRQLAVRQQAGALTDLPIAVQALTQELLTEAVAQSPAGGNPVAGSIAAPAPGELQALAMAFGKANSLSATEQLALYESLWREHRNFISVATPYMMALYVAASSAEIQYRIPNVLNGSELSLTAKTYGYLMQSETASTGIDPDAVAKLTQLVLANPNSIGTWRALGNAYINENVMNPERQACYTCVPAIDHHAGYAKAIVLALEVVRRWPDNYRSWWGLSYSVYWYASLVRGSDYWKDVTEPRRIRFKELMAVADDCSFEAIHRHPDHATLYANRIPFDVNSGLDRMSSFQRAAALAPHSRYVYRMAFGYARPQWGGSMDDLREIYDVARRNNPGEDWPRQLRNASAPEAKPFLDFDNPWVRNGLVAMVVMVLLLGIWRPWSQRRI